MLKAGIGAVQKWVTPGALSDPDVDSVCGKGLSLGSLVRLVGRRFPTGLPAKLLVPRGHRILVHTCAAGDAQRPCASPAPDEQACDVALDALPQRHGNCPDHRRHRHRRRIQELHLPGLLSVPRRFCRGLLVPLAQSRLDDDGRRRLCFSPTFHGLSVLYS